MSVKVTRDESRTLNVLGDSVRVLLCSEDTGGSLTLIEQFSQPGAGVPLHVHDSDSEVFQIIEGELEFNLDGKTVRASAGTVVFAPKQMPHSFAVVGTTPARFQVTIVPGGIEKMFDEIATLSGPPDPKSLTELCARHGVHFLPPKR